MDPLRHNVGSVIARRFAVERLAGVGGMGAVYRAVDLRSGLPIALKLLLHDGGQNGERERFQREIRALAELRHPAIVSPGSVSVRRNASALAFGRASFT